MESHLPQSSPPDLPIQADPGYQSQGTSWSPDRPDIESLLARSRQIEMRSIYYGSNACFLVVLEHPDAGRSLAIYKPAHGEYPLWDFPQGTLYRREVATYRLDDLLGWHIVPPTAIGSGRYGRGSVQLFIEESDAGEVTVESLRHIILLDWITNNADRKPDHVLVSADGRLWGIDHGLTFHAQPKLRTVLWHFAGESLTAEEVQDLVRVHSDLTGDAGRRVTKLIDPVETHALVRRVAAMAERGKFPDPERKAVPYRW